MFKTAIFGLLVLLLHGCSRQGTDGLVRPGDFWVAENGSQELDSGGDCRYVCIEFGNQGRWNGSSCCVKTEGSYWNDPQQGAVHLSIEKIETGECGDRVTGEFFREALALTERYVLRNDSLLLTDSEGKTLLGMKPASTIKNIEKR